MATFTSPHARTHLLASSRQSFGAAPFINYNEKITSECYRPNADEGNFDAISYDLGPTLAAWLEQQHTNVYRRIIQADHIHRQRHGVGNAMAQVYNHTILPLASARDKRTQIVWGLQDFRNRYGYEAHGMWLAETAVDMESGSTGTIWCYLYHSRSLADNNPSGSIGTLYCSIAQWA